jgi:hypothetical protein
MRKSYFLACVRANFCSLEVWTVAGLLAVSALIGDRAGFVGVVAVLVGFPVLCTLNAYSRGEPDSGQVE